MVITGRAADSALFLAPLKYEFGWAADDWDNLARGIMAGHLLECGGQGAGGNYMYDWRNVPRMDELGFPIAELTDDTFEITKLPTAAASSANRAARSSSCTRSTIPPTT